MIEDCFAIQNLRYERKFLLTEMDRYEVESIVKHHPAIFKETYPQRYVNNIYLDTYTMLHYLKNVDGLSRRLKVRIRWYGNLLGFIEKPVLELKIKKGFLGGKKSYHLDSFCLNKEYSHEAQQELFAKSDMPDILVEYLKSLRFALLNRYCRKYFESIDHRFRITIDFNMKFFKINPSFNSFKEMIVDYKDTILELKYSDKDDDLAESITNYFPFRVTKSSKYVSGIEMLKQ